MKNLFIVTAFINSVEKERTVIAALNQLKKCGHKILIVSNGILSHHIISLCDYSIYDSEDWMLPPEKSPVKWYANENMIINLYGKGNSFSVARNIVVALNFAKTIGFQNFVTLEYDNIIHDNDLSKLNEIFNRLIDKKAFFCTIPNGDSEWFDTRVFGGNIDFFLTNKILPAVYEDWVEMTTFGENLIATFEQLCVHRIRPYREFVSFFEGNNRQCFPNSQIDAEYSVNPVRVVYNNDNEQQPVLFLLGVDREYRVQINDNVFTTFVPRYSWTTYPLDLSTGDYNIRVTYNNETSQFNAIINSTNIKEYAAHAQLRINRR
jgi:hypothetical protein